MLSSKRGRKRALFKWDRDLHSVRGGVQRKDGAGGDEAAPGHVLLFPTNTTVEQLIEMLRIEALCARACV